MLRMAEFLDKILHLSKVFSLEQFRDGWLIYCELYSGNKVKMVCDVDNEKMYEHSWKMYFLDDNIEDVDEYFPENKVIKVLSDLNNRNEEAS